MKKILLSFLVVSMAACTSDDSKDVQDDFAGFYKITSIESETAVDLNNDGIESTNILLELTSPHTTMNGLVDGFYNPESPQNLAEAKTSNEVNYSHMNFNFPEQNISYLNFDMELNIPILLDYSTSMNTYGYFIQENRQIDFYDFNPTFNSQFVQIMGFTRDDENNFTLNLKKRMFNFYTKEWILLNLTADYSKV